jgi:Uma2 family endonuclease
LLHKLGDVGPERVRLNPVPGTATVADLEDPENDCCELIDGTLVEKAMGMRESILAGCLIELLRPFVRSRNLGFVCGADGTFELLSGLVRLPDVAFVSWDRVPGRRIPDAPVPNVVPDLAVEVLSRSNSPSEMARKRDEYFRAGVQVVWEIDPVARTVRVYAAPDCYHDLTAADTLTGDPVLPGFALPLQQLFAELDQHG